MSIYRGWRRPAPATPPAGEGRPVMLSIDEAVDLTLFFAAILDPRERKLLLLRSLPGRFVSGLLQDGQLVTIESERTYELALKTWRMQLVEES